MQATLSRLFVIAAFRLSWRSNPGRTRSVAESGRFPRPSRARPLEKDALRQHDLPRARAANSLLLGSKPWIPAPRSSASTTRADIVRTVVERVVTGTKDSLLALNDAAYHETKRLEASRRPSDQKELAEWQKLARSLGRLTDHDRRGRLEELAKRYGWDVAGNFDPRVFQLSTRLLPPIVTALLAPRTLALLVKDPAKVFSAQQATCA